MRAVPPAQVDIPLLPDAAFRLWTDTDRWPTFIEGFARVLERDSTWPNEGGKLVWESNPAGRGRVTEKVLEFKDIDLSEPAGGRLVQVRSRVLETRLVGEQTAVFITPVDPDVAVFKLHLGYDLVEGGPLRAVADVLFIRRALRDMLRRTADRFAVEAEEEAGLR